MRKNFTSGFFRMLIFVDTELLTSFIDIATSPLPTNGNNKIFPFKLYVASIRNRGIAKSKFKRLFTKSKLQIKKKKMFISYINKKKHHKWC